MKFADLSVWNAAMELAEAVFRRTGAFPTEQRYVLAAQMQRAALSIPANIAEGHGRKSTGAFLNHLSIAAGSLRELETQLELARRLALLDESDGQNFAELTDNVGRMLARLSTSLRSK